MKRITSVLLLLAGTALAGAAQAQVFVPGNLVVSVEGNGVEGATSGPYTDNQAAPLTLFQFSHNGTASATYQSALVLPQTASGANHAISGEYGSSSEGGLQLTGNGRDLVIAGYGVNAATFNADPGSFGGVAGNKALAQSAAADVPRVIAVIGANGSVNMTTALTNVFDQNNPRSVASYDGTSFYISGQGTGTDQTGGVFFATLGANSATPITGDDTMAKSSSKTDDATQDTRAVRIVDGQLVVATDSKGGKNNARSYVGTVGTGLPTTDLNAGPTMLPGFGNTGGTGKETISFATGNGVNVPTASSANVTVNLSPNDFFYADANTLYVTDSGNPKNDSTVSSGTSIGDGGLQKWVRNPTTGVWSLEYTLAAGLDLVPNTDTSGTTGLLSLTGEVYNGQVELFATSYTIGDTDPSFLFGITDSLSATSGAGEKFTELAEAPADSTFKGVAFAPIPEPATWALMLAGFGLAGATLRRRRSALA
ncbi:PEPxxWA-CTERM sorting domain-containing protein [Phenylobacterium sp.]|uniref:PEPxxWA-CTERM sorting domain-containing protein n=1 Tax=Phenylobacterium sp. TaxID=1871053 RepID=UPI0025F21DE9|nr:PEPxxWA-CTERM sorting domain-containing protein [Phenylobacterium sp.]